MKTLLAKSIMAICLFSFSIHAQVVRLDSSNLPICIIDTRGKTIVNEPKILAHMKIIDNERGKINKVTDKNFNYNNFIAIEIRGNSSQFYPQKQYGLELRDSTTGEDLDASILGMPEEEDWVLYAPYNDISMLRNVLTYHLWNNMGHWGPRTRFCEVILNNEYVGIYIMMESIKRGADRVDIAKLTAEDTAGRDLTGGYIMKIDKKNNASDLSFVSKVKSTTNTDITWLYHYPESDDIKLKQQNYIRSYIDSIELSISSAGFADPKNGYRKYLSVNSFIDYFLLTELSRNIDAYKASSFFYKEKLEEDGSKGQLKAGPVWDYNFAFGNASFCSGAQTNGWMYDGCMPATLPTPVMWRRLLQDSNYTNAVKCRYLELRKTILDTHYLFSLLNHYAFDTLDAAQKRHFAKWRILGTNPGGFNAYIASSYPDEMNRLKTWIRNRLNWMDANLTGRCIPPPPVAKLEIPLDPECFSGLRPPLSKTQPFHVSPFNYAGTESVKTIPPDILRWVLVELRDGNDSTQLIERRAAFLRSDSVVVDTHFNVGVLFTKAIPHQSYFFVVRYDALSFLMSKEKISLPNDNDYNLNRNHRITRVAANSPVILNNNWPDSVSYQLCLQDSLLLNDSSLVKLGYPLHALELNSSWPHTALHQDHHLLFTFNTPGKYSIQLDLNCKEQTLVSKQLTVQVNPVPVVHISGPFGICPGDSIELQASPASQYLWNTGDTTATIKLSEPGNYSVRISNEYGCKATASKDITGHPDIQGKIAAVPGSTANTCKLYFIPEDLAQIYTYLWSTGSTADTIETAEPLVTLEVSDSNSCTKLFQVLCNPVGNADHHSNLVQILPNPNSGTFQITSDHSIQSLLLYSGAGSLVYSFYRNSNQTDVQSIQIEHLEKGIYFGKLITDSGGTVFKVIVD
ncbi:MAG: CotH kinase family protein [Saprospiraceae bacterium]|nr:CotH kinase family protein [Saprospiraceae bacterium]